MQAYEFYATPENGFIPIPEQYRNRITRGIKVIVLDDWSGKLGHEEIDHNKTDLLLPPSLDTRGWKFNKEEANER